MSSFRRFAKKNDLDETLYTGHIVKKAMGVDWENPRSTEEQKEDSRRNIENAKMEIARLEKFIEEETAFLGENKGIPGFGTGEQVLEDYGFPGSYKK